jgi:hypothetical protein
MGGKSLPAIHLIRDKYPDSTGTQKTQPPKNQNRIKEMDTLIK